MITKTYIYYARCLECKNIYMYSEFSTDISFNCCPICNAKRRRVKKNALIIYIDVDQ